MTLKIFKIQNNCITVCGASVTDATMIGQSAFKGRDWAKGRYLDDGKYFVSCLLLVGVSSDLSLVAGFLYRLMKNWRTSDICLFISWKYFLYTWLVCSKNDTRSIKYWSLPPLFLPFLPLSLHFFILSLFCSLSSIRKWTDPDFRWKMNEEVI